MKTIKTLGVMAVALAALGLFLGSSLTAQDNPAKTRTRQTVQDRGQAQNQLNDSRLPMGRWMPFIDEDGNGICDRFEQGQTMRPLAGHAMAHGRYFIDENGDGMCGYCGMGSMHSGRGPGRNRHGHGSMNRGWR
ncbi:MAG: hypothetical protein ACE5HO_19230 [bacterium]